MFTETTTYDAQYFGYWKQLKAYPHGLQDAERHHERSAEIFRLIDEQMTRIESGES